jgi:MFS family permease
LFAARRKKAPRVRLLLGAALTFSALVAVSGFMPSYLLFMLLLVPIGGAGILLATSCNTTLQLSAAPQLQSRVMALYTTVFVGCAPFGSLLVGWLGGALGARWALLFSGSICVAAVLGCAVFYLRSQQVEVRFADHLWWPRGVRDDELAEDALAADVGSR